MPNPTTKPPVIPPMKPEGIIGRKLVSGSDPSRIVVVRLHAFGDAVIALPLIAGLRRRYPRAEITLVTSDIYRDLFESVTFIDRVEPFPTGSSRIVRAAAAVRLAAILSAPDLLLDIQRSTVALLLGSLMRPTAWAGFDRFAPEAALDRYLEAARWVGIDELEPEYTIPLRAGLAQRADELLGDTGAVSGARPLVCLNPAGCWPTKNWPVERYIELGGKFIEEWGARIVLMGTDNVRGGAAAIAGALGGDVIDLVGRTTTAEVLAIVARLALMVSDDSGLMHLAWASGIPTVGIFGASRATWSRPFGPHSICFGSEDLDCGACMSPVCARGDTVCLQRVGVGEVFGAARRERDER